MSQLTGYPDLNRLLGELVAGARAALAANFCGAYLQGSFALGAADEHSDVDFVIVTHTEVSETELGALQQLHRRLYSQEVAWAQHLEGSYIPAETLRHVDPERRPLLYLDNGAQELELDSHCNSAAVRWVLRERGVTLAGPDPTELVSPVDPASLRSEGIDALNELAQWAPAPTKAGVMSEWKQVFLVLALCRILCGLESGTIVSKQQGGEWALRTLDPEWHELIAQALADRTDPWQRVHRTADAATASATLAFVEYVTSDVVPGSTPVAQ